MIEINNLTKFLVDKEWVEEIIERVLKGERKKIDLSIALVGKARMKKINKKYRDKDKSTDVLSFSDLEKGKLKESNITEIILCPAEIKKNAQRMKESFRKELAFCIIHGTLHILGYDHEKNEKEAKKMKIKENKYLTNS